MSVLLSPARLSGSVCAPPSKSAAHRAILCAALARGESVLSPISLSNDMRATIGAVRALGAEADLQNDKLFIKNTNRIPKSAKIDCLESGSTLRFLIPVFAALGVSAVFTGSGRLPQRPIGLYAELLPQHGVACRTQGGLPFSMEGQLESGVYELPGNISSQFITGLLLALPLLKGDSEIVLTSPLESAAYVDMTLQALAESGIIAHRTETGWSVPGGQRYLPRVSPVEGDWSQAAFFLAAAALGRPGDEICITGLNRDSFQGDRAAEDLFSRMGAQLFWKGNDLYARSGNLRGISIDASQIPDLVPALAAAAALAQGETRIYNAGRLRIKESDRLAAMAQGLNRLGARVTEREDGLVIAGVPALLGGKAEGFNDHRIVMALAIAALRAQGETAVTDAHSINKSYPDFFEIYNRLGGNAHVIHLGNQA